MGQPSPLMRVTLAAAYALLGWLLFTSLWGLYLGHFPGVYVDMWDEMPFLQRLDEGRSTLHDWANAYAGSHRLLLSRFVFAIEHSVFQHANVFTIMVSVIFHLLAIVTACRFIHNTPVLAERRGLYLVVLAAGFSALHLYNLHYTFLVQWFQVVAFSFLAFACLIRSTQAAHGSGQETAATVLAFALALAASFCNFPGVVALLNLGLLGIALNHRWRWLLAIACLLAVLAHVGSMPGPGMDRGALLDAIAANPLALLAYPMYTLRFLGTPLTPIHEAAGMLLGTLIAGYTGWHGIRWMIGKNPQTPAGAFALAGLMWLCGTAAATALGRAWIPVTAIAERFHTIHLWLVPLLLLHWLLSCNSVQTRKWLVLGGMGWLALLTYWQPLALQQALETAQKVRMSHIAYTIGMNSWRTHALLSVPHKATKYNPALEWRDYLQATGNGIYATEAAHWMGQLFTQPLQELPSCIRNVALDPVEDGYLEIRIAGNGDDPITSAWLIDPQGQVQGYALPVLPTGLFQAGHGLRGYMLGTDDWTVIGNPTHRPCLIGSSL
ncbi:MAG: hypothetical protein EP312_09215 [Gammaproteobacteria bacterium]|nr:MAG: hypothetical protein EP312_09215 [Gammaproteobacteria bacterium]